MTDSKGSAAAPLARYTAKEAQQKVLSGAILLDVREDVELRIAAVPGAQHIPMSQVPGRIAEIDRSREVVCMCHHGMRSESVAEYLRDNGFTRVANLEGGIAAWSAEVDASIPQY